MLRRGVTVDRPGVYAWAYVWGETFVRVSAPSSYAAPWVFGGFGGYSSVGLWTEPPAAAHWYFLINLARVCNYTYVFEFAEDWRRVEIKIRGNLCCCCFCLPWLPAWFQVPDKCATFSATQLPESKDGSAWSRDSSVCGGEETKTYELLEARAPEIFARVPLAHPTS